MSNNDEYNGWTNRETWALMLYINNDQGLYEMFRERLSDFDTYPDGSTTAPQVVQEVAREVLDPDEYRAEFGTEQSADLRRMAAEVGSWWRVNWTEVVESLREGVDES